MSSNPKKDDGQLFLTPLRGKIRERKYAVYDLETTTDLQKVFLAGFYDGSRYRYFESDPAFPETPNGAIDQFLTWLFADDEYVGYWIYAHNGGNFDALYLIRWLMDHAKDYSIEVIPVQSTVLSLEVHEKKTRRRQRKWTFIDSLRLMNAGLDKLGKSFGLGGKE